MTSTETIRTALAGLWDTGANAYELAQAVMQAADIESADLELEVESVIARALLARELVDLAKVAEEAAKVLPGEAGSPKLTLFEAIIVEIERATEAIAAMRAKDVFDDGWVGGLRRASGIIRKHFAALSVEEFKRVLYATDGGIDETAQAVLRLMRKE